MNYLKYRINTLKEWITEQKDTLTRWGFMLGTVAIYMAGGYGIAQIMYPNALLLGFPLWMVGLLLGLIGWAISMFILVDYANYKDKQRRHK